MKVDIYIRVESKGNPRGHGKGAAIVEFVKRNGTEVTRVACVEVKNDTRNALYLMAINAALKILTKPCEVTVHCCNTLISSAVKNKWLMHWSENGWKKSDGETPANLEEWKKLHILSNMHKISWTVESKKYKEDLDEALRF